jgi:serine/threonine protein kinase
MSQLDEMLKVGDLFGGRYKLIRMIGEGGFGQVWLAHDPKLERDVAIKFLLPEAPTYAERLLREAMEQEGEELERKATYAAVSLQRFETEAKICASLKSDYAIKIYDYGEENGSFFFMIMEYLNGLSLHDYLRRHRRLSAFETLIVLDQVLDVLAEAHREGIFHRDIKPENIMVLDQEGQIRVKLLDFGISKLTEGARLAKQRELLSLTQNKGAIGSLGYMSPEHLAGQPLTPATDIFSLGLVAVEMLTGERVRMSTHDVVKDVNLDDFQMPGFMGQLLTGMLERNSTKRFGSANQVRNLIHDLMEEHGPGGRGVSGSPRFGATPFQADPQASSQLYAPEPDAVPTPRLGHRPIAQSHPLDIQGMERTELVPKNPRRSRNMESIAPGNELDLSALGLPTLSPPQPLVDKPLLVGIESKLPVKTIVLCFLAGGLLMAGMHQFSKAPQAQAVPSEQVLHMTAAAVSPSPAQSSDDELVQSVAAASERMHHAVGSSAQALSASSASPVVLKKNSSSKQAAREPAPKLIVNKEPEPVVEPAAVKQLPAAVTKKEEIKKDDAKPKVDTATPEIKQIEDKTTDAPPVRKRRKVNPDYYLDI